MVILSRGTSRDGTGQSQKIPARPVPWQDFELVPLSLCPGTKKFCLSRCPEKFHCPVPLETLVGNSLLGANFRTNMNKRTQGTLVYI